MKNEQAVKAAFEYAAERYAAIGVDVNEVLKKMQGISLSLHCWQTDDVSGFENPDGELTGGIQATGNYPGKARNIDEVRADLLKVKSLLPGSHRINLHEVYGDFGGKKKKVGIHLFDILTDAFDAVAGVHQIQGGSHHVGGIKQGDDLRGHDADHRDDVALFHPGAPQGGGGLFDVDDEVGVGELPAIVVQCRVVQVVLAPLADILKGREGRQGLIDEFLVVILEPGLGLGCVNRILRRHQFLIPLCL